MNNILQLNRVSSKHFITRYLPLAPPGAPNVFGGIILAQSLLASLNCIPNDFIPISLHAYFIVGGDTRQQIEYKVETLRNGNNFIHQQVKAFQLNKLIYTTMILFSKGKNELNTSTHQEIFKKWGNHHRNTSIEIDAKVKIDAVKLLTEYEKFKGEKGLRNNSDFIAKFESQPLQYKFPEDFYQMGGRVHNERLKYLVRFKKESVKDNFLADSNQNLIDFTDERINYVLFAYLSDSYLLLTLPYFHNLRMYSHKFSVSLDHTIYFHKLPRLMNGDWFNSNIKNLSSRDNRHVMSCDMFESQDNECVATVAQEGLVTFPIKSKL